MKILVFTLSLVLLLSAAAFALDIKKVLGIGDSGSTETTAADDATKTIYVIHLNSGGKIVTDNYVIDKNSIRIIMLTGAVNLDKSMVKSIEEVKGEDQETVQTIKIKPLTGGGAAAPSGQTAAQPRQPEDYKAAEDKDDNGHNKAWWQKRVKEWRDKKADAMERQKKADEDWNMYNGLLTTTRFGTYTSNAISSSASPGGYTGYDTTKYEDLRGAARTEGDKAEADVNVADKMLNETLPEEARKAGAPPGWLRE